MKTIIFLSLVLTVNAFGSNGFAFRNKTFQTGSYAQSIQYSTATGAETITDERGVYITEPASTEATKTITMPPNPRHGQVQNLLCGNVTGGCVTLLTVSPNSGQNAVRGAPTTFGQNTAYAFVYDGNSTNWFLMP